MNTENAQSIAIAGLTFLANEPARLSRFLGLTGINPDELRSLSENGEFLPSVLEYFMGDEPTLLEFAASENLAPVDIGKAFHVLAGISTGDAYP